MSTVTIVIMIKEIILMVLDMNRFLIFVRFLTDLNRFVKQGCYSFDSSLLKATRPILVSGGRTSPRECFKADKTMKQPYFVLSGKSCYLIPETTFDFIKVKPARTSCSSLGTGGAGLMQVYRATFNKARVARMSRMHRMGMGMGGMYGHRMGMGGMYGRGMGMGMGGMYGRGMGMGGMYGRGMGMGGMYGRGMGMGMRGMGMGMRGMGMYGRGMGMGGMGMGGMGMRGMGMGGMGMRGMGMRGMGLGMRSMYGHGMGMHGMGMHGMKKK